MYILNCNTLKDSVKAVRNIVNVEPDISAAELAKKINSSTRLAYLYKYYFLNLNDTYIRNIDALDNPMDPEIILAVMLAPKFVQNELFSNLEDLLRTDNFLVYINEVATNSSPPEPLDKFKGDYWKLVCKYLQDRNVDAFPYTENALKFLGGRHKQSKKHTEKQLSWLISIIKEDHSRGINAFSNATISRTIFSYELGEIANIISS